jgi:hypothetical protein
MAPLLVNDVSTSRVPPGIPSPSDEVRARTLRHENLTALCQAANENCLVLADACFEFASPATGVATSRRYGPEAYIRIRPAICHFEIRLLTQVK